MSDEELDRTGPVEARGAVARLAEALAAAQRVAREIDDDVETEDVAPGDPALRVPIAPIVIGRAVPEGDDVVVAATEGMDGGAGVGAVLDAGEHTPVAGLAVVGDDTPGTGRGLDSDDDPTSAVPVRRMWPLHVAMAVLIVAVPVLGYVGYRLTSDSTTGTVVSGSSDSESPGYMALVEPTPVALVIHTADDGAARGLTLLSLSGPDQRGGAIVAVPVDVRLDRPGFGIHDFAASIERTRPETAGKVIGRQLGLGFTEVVTMTDAELVRFVEPVSPLRFDNPEDVTTAEGELFEAGPIELGADEVPAYLSASDEGNTSSGALERQQLLWSTWVGAIGDAGDAAVVPGETQVGLGRYLGALAQGTVQTASFPVNAAPDDGKPGSFVVDRAPADLLIANAVPFPVAAEEGDRASVAVMNGHGPGSAPGAVIQRLTFAGAQIIAMGNAADFDHAETTLTYSGRAMRASAQRMADTLGVGRVVESDRPDAEVDVRVVMGADLLEDPPGPLTASEVIP